jgi:hypothetical protein
MRFRFTPLLPLVAGFLLAGAACPSPAWAIISHRDPQEAFFIRQFSYLFFMIAMVFFAYALKHGKFRQHRGFRLLIWASVFFALWNLNCFVGQIFFQHYEPLAAAGDAGLFSQRLVMTDVRNWINYFTKLDHLLLVPAFVFFYLGLRACRREQEAGP